MGIHSCMHYFVFEYSKCIKVRRQCGQCVVSFICTLVTSVLPCTGVEKVHALPSGLSLYEQDALKALMPELSSSIQKGIDFAHKA